MADFAALKRKLVQKCIEQVEGKLRATDEELEFIQQSANDETKSSAGDKYETGRAMLMLEKEKLLGHKEQLFQQLKPLKLIDTKKQLNSVELGAIVITTSNIFFISAGVGSVEIEDDTYMAVSAMAPIVRKMFSKREGDTFSFMGTEYRIDKII